MRILPSLSELLQLVRCPDCTRRQCKHLPSSAVQHKNNVQQTEAIIALELVVELNDLLRSLDEFNENAFAGERAGSLALRMHEGDVVARSTLANTTRSEADSLLSEGLHASGKVINPQTNVVERRVVHLGALVGIVGLHDIDLDGHGSLTAAEHVFLHVLLGRLH